MGDESAWLVLAAVLTLAALVVLIASG